MWKISARLPAAFLTLALALVTPVHADLCANGLSVVTVNAWETWEQRLTSVNDYTAPAATANPYADVSLKVTLKNCTTGYTFTQNGFWYGLTPQSVLDAHEYRVRAAFPAASASPNVAGTWQWTTSCTKTSGAPSTSANCANDSGLVNKTGKIQISAQSLPSKRKLPRGGYLDISNNGHYLTLARPGADLPNPGPTEGTPFFWLGDAAWAAPVLANLGDWQSYVDQRTAGAHPFTVVQIGVSPSSAANPLVDRGGNPPFDSPTACTPDKNLPLSSCSRFNPLYWANMDAKIQYANQKGLLVLLAGSMDPFQKSLGDACATVDYSSQAVTALARNLAGRYAGSAVILSPGFDHKICSTFDQIILSGQTMKAGSPRSFVTDHPAGSSLSSDIQRLTPLSWLSFQMYQSGTPSTIPTNSLLENITGRASQMALDLSKTNKPVVNGEAAYDKVDLAGDTNSPYRVRQTAYLSFLSGAMGYSMGSCGTFDWGAGLAGCNPHTWQSVMGGLSSRSMNALRGNLESVGGWWLLRPESGRITNQASLASQAMVLAYDGSREILAYLPHEAASVTINFRSGSGFAAVPNLATLTSKHDFLSSGWSYSWLSPRSGTVFGPALNNTDLTYVSTGKFTFAKPSCDADAAENPCKNDYVLKLTRATTAPLGGTAALRVSNDPAPGSSDTRIYGHLVDSTTGNPIADIDMGGDAGNTSAPPVVTVEPGGNVLVVWESDSDAGSVIDGRIYAPNGSPVTSQFVVSGDAVDAAHPAVTALPAGGFAVAWSRSDATGSGPWIYYRTMSPTGTMGFDSLVINCAPVAGDYPMLQADDFGGIQFAWQVSDGSGIYVIDYDSLGSPSDGYVAQGTGGWPVLEDLGTSIVTWSSYGSNGTSTTVTGDTTDVWLQPTMCR